MTICELTLCQVLFLSSGDPRSFTERQLLDAICHVESGGVSSCPDGDGGRSIGPYQIKYLYWRDAVKFDPSIGGTYQDCRKRAYSEKVIRAFMRRHVPEAWKSLDAEVLVRTHNGGPKGAANPATLAYWEKVLKVLESPPKG